MNQFRKILSFELKNYFTNKIFVGITLFLVAAIAVVMFLPGIMDLVRGDETPESAGIPSGAEIETAEDDGRPVMLVLLPEDEPELEQVFAAGFPEYRVEAVHGDMDELRRRILAGEAECAFALDSSTSYTYLVENLSMIDSNTAVADSILQSYNQMTAMVTGGMTQEQAQQVLAMEITHTQESLGKDQGQNFWYTYIMIFALYMVILLYGQMIATNVATEKSSRAMELLITSANPVSMMFGKVMASCIAGASQILAVFGSALLFYSLSRGQWGDNPVIASIFGMPGDLLVYMLVFFVLGFLIYAFLFGAIGSTASKLEDINTSSMPVTLVFVFAFLVVMFSMSSGNVDSMLMKVCSFVPFTSPMAMFTRLAMSTVPWYEVAVSISVLVVSVCAVGVLAAKIYRVGVLMYGTPPKLSAIIKALKRA